MAQVLSRLDPQGQCLFLTTNRAIDRDILKNYSFAVQTQPILPLPNRLGQVIKFYKSWRKTLQQCRELFTQRQPDVVLGLGGFAAPAAMKIAHQQNIPVAMLNPDMVPGKANRYGARFADPIFVQWSATAEHFGSREIKCKAFGCPIRDSIMNMERDKAAAMLGLRRDLKTLVVMGGSLGGHNVNEAVLECFAGPLSENNFTAEKIQDWQIVHLTGRQDCNRAKAAYDKLPLDAKVLAFTDRISVVLACADLVIARAGASSLAELTAKGLPSILLPYPYHKDRHQWHNAEIVQRTGAAQIVEDYRDTAKTAAHLAPVLADCLLSEGKRQNMAQASHSIGRPGAAEQIARELAMLATNRYNNKVTT